MIITKENSEHYIWGDNCDGWYFLKRNDVSVIQEKMPSGTSEIKHFHKETRQFFYILNGTASIDIEGIFFEITANSGIEIQPFQVHQIFNKSNSDLEFLLISCPCVNRDRVNL
jgi:mannose-6-phosphate isomerase-like protein (cupin superfamily)